MPETSSSQKEPAFPVLERDLARRSGLSIETLRELRNKHLVEGTDYARRARRIAYSELAAADLVAMAGLPKSMAAPPAEARRAPRGALPVIPGTLVQLCVWRTEKHGISNLRILEAYYKGSDPEERINIVRVKVGDNRRFVRHMEIWGRLEQADLFEHWDPERDIPGRPPR